VSFLRTRHAGIPLIEVVHVGEHLEDAQGRLTTFDLMGEPDHMVMLGHSSIEMSHDMIVRVAGSMMRS